MATKTASSNLAQLLIMKEAVLGVTPTTGKAQTLRMTGESLKGGITTETSQEIRADRNVADLIQTGADSSGDINFELSYGTYDMLIAAALGGAWVTNKVKNGIVLDTFSVQQGFTDVNQYIIHKGMGVNSMNLDFSTEAIITGSFGFMGVETGRFNTSKMPASPDPATTTEVMDSVSGFADLKLGGAAQECLVSRVALNIEAGLRAQKALGKMGACSLNLGTLTITGEIVVYFTDGAMYDKYIENSAVALEWTVKDKAGNKYLFELPRIKFTDLTVNAGSLDQDVELTLPFQAIFDSTAGFSIQITRTPVAPPGP